jgi:hypothetical protein
MSIQTDKEIWGEAPGQGTTVAGLAEDPSSTPVLGGTDTSVGAVEGWFTHRGTSQ